MSEKVFKKGDEGMVCLVWPVRGFLFLCVLGLVLLKPLQAFSQSGNIEEEQPSYFSHVFNLPNPTESSLRYFPVEEPTSHADQVEVTNSISPGTTEPIGILGRWALNEKGSSLDSLASQFSLGSRFFPTPPEPSLNGKSKSTLNRFLSSPSLLGQINPDESELTGVQPFGNSFLAEKKMVWRYGRLLPTSSSSSELKPLSLYGDISIILNPAVEKNVRYFQTVIPDRFQEWLTRFYRYEPMVAGIFEEFGLPHDLVYLSLVESGFNPRAYSRARATGPWQFMKATGRLYGLRVNWYVDERRDPVKSTVAAARHLRDLYDKFGSWPLALAAYNAGAGKIQRAIRKSRSQDYWKIARTRYIRRETREYVPRFMAATIIATSPTLFGFKAGSSEVHQYEEVPLRKTVHLRSVAKETGISYEELRRLNPELRRSLTPAHKKGYYLKVPMGMGDHVRSVRDQIKVWTQPPTQITWYRVRRGDSLSGIANRFGTSVRKLKTLNNLSRNLIRVGDRLRVGAESPPPSGDVNWYRVRPGDSLWSIARQFSVTVRDLMALNQLRGSLIHTGRLLLVSSP